MRILLATDGSPHAARAAEYAGQLARNLKEAEITLIHVRRPIELSGDEFLEAVQRDRLEEAANTAARRLLADARRPLADAGLNVLERLEQGRPSQVIAEVADREGFDLIIAGSRGLSELKGLLLGSVSDQLVHVAKTPVLVVK